MVKIIKILFLLIFVSNCMHVSLAKGTRNLARYAPPAAVALFLDDLCERYDIQPHDVHHQEILTKKLKEAGFSFVRASSLFYKLIVQLPAPYDNFLLKINCAPYSGRRNCSRVFVAEKIRTIIKNKHFNNLTVPQKYLYKLPKASKILRDSHYLVLVEKLPLNKEKLIFDMPDKVLQQLYYVIKKVLYFDHGYYVDTNKRVVVFDFNLCVDNKGQIAFIDTEDGNVLGNGNSMELGNGITTITHVLEHSGCKGQAPREALLAHVLIREGQKRNNKKLITYGKNILRKLYTVYCGFFPFVVTKGELVLPFVKSIVTEIDTITEKIIKHYPIMKEYYHQALTTYKQENRNNFQRSCNEVVTHVWQHWYSSKGAAFTFSQKDTAAASREEFPFSCYAPPQEVSHFLDALCRRYAIYSASSDKQAMIEKLTRAGFVIVRESYPKIIAELPSPYSHYLVKMNCAFDCGQFNCSRVFVADKIRKIITQQQFKNIYVPKKYLYKIPQAPANLVDANYFVLVEKVALNKGSLLFNLPDNALAEMYEIIRRVHYFDHGYYIDTKKNIFVLDFNICLDTYGRIVFVDTEDSYALDNLDTVRFGNNIDVILRTLGHSGCADYVPQEAILAQVIIEEGFKKNDLFLIDHGKQMLRKLYTVCGFFPFAIIQHEQVMPLVKKLLHEIIIIKNIIFNDYPEVQEWYHKKLLDYSADHAKYGKNFHYSVEEIVLHVWGKSCGSRSPQPFFVFCAKTNDQCCSG